MPNIQRGEVWLLDLGMAAKVRPAVVVSIPLLDNERAVYAIVPHTTGLRGGRFEVVIDVPWLEPGAFDVQGMRNLPRSVFMRRLGDLDPAQIQKIAQTIRLWLGIGSTPLGM
jgi:mRNA interferase MazF